MMKLNWFAPLPPAATDIANYTLRVLRELAPRADVTLWTEQREWNRNIEKSFGVEVRRLDAMHPDWQHLNAADLNIYHIGNNPQFHGAIWRIAQRQPGLIVLHDFRLHHFFDGLYREQRRDLETYLAVMERYYGEQGAADGRACFECDATNINEMAERYPLTPHALENALGVLTHTREAYNELHAEQQSYLLAYTPLPFPSDVRQTAARAPRSFTEKQPARLIVFGFLGTNRRLDAILAALAGMDAAERARLRLDIYGAVSEEAHVRAAIEQLGLTRSVTLHGFATEEKLDAALAQADFAFNLRYPTMGEASGSQLRIWAHALPSVVTRTGWYASLSERAVLYARPDENEVADLRHAVRALFAAPREIGQMGATGRAILERAHAPQLYVERLLQFAAEVKQQAPRFVAFDLATRAGEFAGVWAADGDADNYFLQHAAEEINALFNAPVKS